MGNVKNIFIVGNSRSGTTMLGRILGNHSLVYTFGELHFFEQQIDISEVNQRKEWEREKLISMLERLLTISRDGFFCQVVPGNYRYEAEKILAVTTRNDPVSAYDAFLKFETKLHGKTISCEQTPRYLFSALEILEAFPEARMINIVRDPRDVLLSQKNKWRRRFLGANNIPLCEAFRAWVNYHPYTITRLWVSAVRTAHRLEKHHRFMSIHFEDLLQEPDKQITELCEFVGIKFEQGMLSVPQIGSSIGFDNPAKKGIDGSRSREWKKGGLTSVELAICQEVAAAEMMRLGFDVELTAISVWRRLGSMLLFGFKISIALLLNLRRSKNMVQSIRRRFLTA